jgi:hypothetical protein
MPRKAPTDVYEQRVSLGTFERQLMQPYLDARKREAYLKTGLYAGLGLASVATVGTMAWLGIQAYALVGGAADELAQKWEDAKDAVNTVIVGPETVDTAKPVPRDSTGQVSEDLGINALLGGLGFADTRDPDDPTKRINPAAGFPIPGVGWLFGKGMEFGEVSFNATEKAARSKKNPLNWLP